MLGNLAVAVLGRSEAERALALLTESLTLFWRGRNKWRMTHSLENVGAVASARGEPERGARLIGAAAALRAAIGAPLPPVLRAQAEQVAAVLRAALGDEAYAAALAAGRAMPLDQAVAYALTVRPTPLRLALPSDQEYAARQVCLMADPIRALVVKESSGVERVVPLEQDLVTIGRDADSTIRLDSPYVSRPHARVEVRDDGVALVDLGSRNGSLLNGVRVNGTVPLHDGDVITIADATIECFAEPPDSGATREFVRAVDEIAPDRIRVDELTYELWVGDHVLERRLSAQEFELVRYLYEHRDRVCKRQELGDAVWGAQRWDTNMLHKLMHRLKDKLEPDPEHPRYVQTVPWIGYRLLA